jgi:SAM-dependent methyltransferase
MYLDIDLFSNHLFIIKKLQRNAFRRAAPELRGRILDVGSGSSPYSAFLKDCSCVTIDVSSTVSPDALSRADALSFNGATFDAAVCTEVLEHLKDPRAAVWEIHRVLRPEGILYLTAPQTWGLHYEPYDYWRFTVYGLRALLEEVGFDVLRVERIGGICSLVGARVMDVCWILLTKAFCVCGSRWSERIATALCLPGNVVWYCTALVADRVHGRDALGWALLARKRPA